MPSDTGRILRSRVVVPVVQPPIDNGAVFLCQGRIQKVGRWSDLRELSTNVDDLGEGVLLPGLVNSHCHLDFTNLAGVIPKPDSFAAWVKQILGLSAQWTESQWTDSWRKGLRQLQINGVTTVANIESRWNLLGSLRSELPLRVISFLEMTGLIAGKTAEQLIDEAMTLRSQLLDSGEIGLSPHSVYATVRGLLEETAKVVRSANLRTTIHLSESKDEAEMFGSASGALYDALSQMGRDMSDCGDTSPTSLVEKANLLRSGTLAVHGNYLNENDMDLLADTESSVVHCPSCHAYFDHQDFPYDELQSRGVNIALGTDSLASVVADEWGAYALNMFTEMRRFASAFPDVSSDKIFKMATSNGADALGLTGVVGTMKEGADADLVFVKGQAAVKEAVDWLVHDVRYTSRVMIGGNWSPTDLTNE
ncbi:amidohydrolase family protein [Verrucomicrobia bacterium]|nr:amidohydrolase family protein [Verrucomicrobiota bacterium]